EGVTAEGCGAVAGRPDRRAMPRSVSLVATASVLLLALPSQAERWRRTGPVSPRPPVRQTHTGRARCRGPVEPRCRTAPLLTICQTIAATWGGSGRHEPDTIRPERPGNKH